MSLIYTGIGSRQTPETVLNYMNQVAQYLSANWTLRSGHAEGADQAFEQGCTGAKEIYVPWPTFNGSTDCIDPSTFMNYQKAMTIAEQMHPNWAACKQGVRKLHTRNIYQILGADLQTTSDLVICWTSDGKDSGGTGQALRLARKLNIPVFNLHNPQCEIDLPLYITLLEDQKSERVA